MARAFKNRGHNCKCFRDIVVFLPVEGSTTQLHNAGETGSIHSAAFLLLCCTEHKMGGKDWTCNVCLHHHKSIFTLWNGSGGSERLCPTCIKTNSGKDHRLWRQSEAVGSNCTTLEIIVNGGKKFLCSTIRFLTVSGQCCLGNHQTEMVSNLRLPLRSSDVCWARIGWLVP